MQTQPIPLSQLRHSDRNVRKTGGMSIDDIAASIVAHGLIHNLIVTPLQDGQFGVVAGGRRLKALQQLVDAQQIPADFVVPCRVIDATAARETSLAENVQRQAMHPADEFDEFAALVAEGRTAADVAERFGCTEKHVQQRLRLARVAPKILAEYRAGDATLEQMMALALVDDHDAQLKAWGTSNNHEWNRRPDQLRNTLTRKDVSPNSKLGRFITVAEYEAAGGVPRTDLFSDLVTLPDVAIATKAAHAKLQPEVEKLQKKGWGWVEILLEADHYEVRSKYRQRDSAKPDAKLGAIISLDYNGKPQTMLGLVKPGAKAPASGKAAAGKKGPKVSASLSREEEYRLQGLRTAALRGLVGDCRWTALATLAASMAAEVFDKEAAPVDTFLGIGGNNWPSSVITDAAAKADPAGEKARANWRKQITEGVRKHGSILAWLLSPTQKDGEKTALELLHACITLSLVADAENEEFVHDYAKLIDVDGSFSLAEKFTLTTDWLAKQSKAYIVAEVRAAVGEAQAKAIDKLKTADAAKAAFPLLSIAKWQPEPLRPPAPKPEKKAPAKKAAPKKKTAVKG